jgi:predicted CoA-binding protein
MTASPEKIARLMAAKRVAVVGASNDPTDVVVLDALIKVSA